MQARRSLQRMTSCTVFPVQSDRHTSMTMDDIISDVSYSQPWSQGTTDHDALGTYVATTEEFSIVVVVAIQSISYRVHWLYVSLSSCFYMISFSARPCDIAWIMHSLLTVRQERSYRTTSDRMKQTAVSTRPRVNAFYLGCYKIAHIQRCVYRDWLLLAQCQGKNEL